MGYAQHKGHHWVLAYREEKSQQPHSVSFDEVPDLLAIGIVKVEHNPKDIDDHKEVGHDGQGIHHLVAEGEAKQMRALSYEVEGVLFHVPLKQHEDNHSEDSEVFEERSYP